MNKIRNINAYGTEENVLKFSKLLGSNYQIHTRHYYDGEFCILITYAQEGYDYIRCNLFINISNETNPNQYGVSDRKIFNLDTQFNEAYEYLFNKKLESMKQNGWKVLKPFAGKKAGDFINIPDLIYRWFDSNNFEISSSLDNLKNNGFITENYEEEYKIGEIVITNCIKNNKKTETYIVKLSKNDNQSIVGAFISKDSPLEFFTRGAFENIIRRANSLEITQFYSAYAKRYYKKGVAFKSLINGEILVISNDSMIVSVDKENNLTSVTVDTEKFSSKNNYGNGARIYNGEEWAEIVKEEILSIGDTILDFRSDGVYIRNQFYSKQELIDLQKILTDHQDQIKYLAVGCNAQYKVDLHLLNKIINRLNKEK